MSLEKSRNSLPEGETTLSPGEMMVFFFFFFFRNDGFMTTVVWSNVRVIASASLSSIFRTLWMARDRDQ